MSSAEMRAVLAALSESRDQLETEADALAKRALEVLNVLSDQHGPNSEPVQAMKDFINQITQVVNIDGDKYSDQEIQSFVASKTDELDDLEALYLRGAAIPGTTAAKSPVQASAFGPLLLLGGIGVGIWWLLKKKG